MTKIQAGRRGHRTLLLAALLLGAGCREGCDPCEGLPFQDQGAPVATSIGMSQVHAMGDMDADGVRDLLSLETTSGALHVLGGPDFRDVVLATTLPGFIPDQPWRYALSVFAPDPIEARQNGELYLLDRKAGSVSSYGFGEMVQKTGETLLALDDAGRAALNQTTAFAAIWDGAYPLSTALFALGHTLLTPSGYVELEFFYGSRTYKNPGCATPQGSRCITKIPAEGEVEYLLADWDKASRFTNRPERVDVISVARNAQGTSYTVWFGETSWSEAQRLELSSPLRIDDDASRLQGRAVALVLGADTPFGGSGGISRCPFLGACTCGVAVREPTLFALNRCRHRAPSGAPEIYRLNNPRTISFEATWLRDWPCPVGQPISD
jgi:hypothetical protein